MQAGFPYPTAGAHVMENNLIFVESLIEKKAGSIDLAEKMRKLSFTPVRKREARIDFINTINVTLLILDLPRGHNLYRNFTDCLRREVRKSKIGLMREKSDLDYIHGYCGDLALIYNLLRHYEIMSSQKGTEYSS